MEEFIKLMIDLFEDTDPAQITPQAKFKAMDEWSSLMALGVISLVDDEYEVLLEGEDLDTVETLQELYDLVQARKA